MILFEFYRFKWKKKKNIFNHNTKKKTLEKEYKMTTSKEYKRMINDIKWKLL